MPLFPPPLDPRSHKRCKNHGLQSYTVVTVIGEVTLRRRWWSCPSEGSFAPVDDLIDLDHATYTVGVREIACRLNNDGKSFDGTAENLDRSAQIQISGEQLRLLVEAEGARVRQEQQASRIAPAFEATACVIPPQAQAKVPIEVETSSSRPTTGPLPKTRLYVGVDGVMVPVITDEEKIKRRKNVCQKRQQRGRKCRPLPPRRRGWTGNYREFKVVTFYDETGKYNHHVLCAGKRTQLGVHIRREALRINFLKADERIGNVDSEVDSRAVAGTAAALEAQWPGPGSLSLPGEPASLPPRCVRGTVRCRDDVGGGSDREVHASRLRGRLAGAGGVARHLAFTTQTEGC